MLQTFQHRLWPPEPVALSLPSALPPDAATTRIEQAVATARYSVPGRGSLGYVRLGGQVVGNTFDLRVKGYIIPGVRSGSGAYPLRFKGVIARSDEGSRVEGLIDVPVPVTLYIFPVVAILVPLAALQQAGDERGAAALAWLLLGVAGMLALTIGSLWAIRHNQRMAMRGAFEVERLLSAILSDREG